MNNNEATAISTKIWERSNTIQNAKKSKEEQIELIKRDVVNFAHEQRRIGRRQVLREMDDKIAKLRKLY